MTQAAEPIREALVTQPALAATIFTPPPPPQGRDAFPEQPAPAPSALDVAAEASPAGEAFLSGPESTAITSQPQGSWSRARFGLSSAWNRLRLLTTRRSGKRKASAEPRAPRHLRRLAVIVGSALVLVAAGVGLLLGGAHRDDAKRRARNAPPPPVAAVVATAPSIPGDSLAAKPAVAIPETVPPAEAAPVELPAPSEPAASSSDSSTRRTQAAYPRRGLKAKKLAHREGPSKRAKPHARAGPGRKPARKQNRPTATAAAVADPAARSLAAYQEGNAKLFSGEATGAIKAYQESIRLNPKHPAGYRGLGLAYTQAGRKPEAVKAFSRYLKLAPTAKDHAIITDRIRILKSQ